MKTGGFLKSKLDVDKVRLDIESKILSMSEIARQMEISKSNLSRFLKGDLENSDAMILRCIDWLGKTTDDYSNEIES